jgi:membrane carboxypeptidase/penicillin-binding protein PbpC
VIGVAEGSRVLMQRELSALSDAEAAELQLAIPPLDYWDELWECKNAGVVREARDTFIARLAQQGLLAEADARTATAAPVRCMSVKR